MDEKDKKDTKGFDSKVAKIFAGLEVVFPKKRIKILSHPDTSSEYVNGVMMKEEYQYLLKALSSARKDQSSKVYLPFEVSAEISLFNKKVPFCDGQVDDEGFKYAEKQKGYRMLTILMNASGGAWGYRYSIPVVNEGDGEISLDQGTFSSWDQNESREAMLESDQVNLMESVCNDLCLRIEHEELISKEMKRTPVEYKIL